MLDLLIDAVQRFRIEARNRRALRGLLEKPEYELRDIGLTRADIETALQSSYRVDARQEANRLSTYSLRLDGAQ